MAENVEITAGTGTTIAADDISNIKYQKVKLVDGTADSTTVITAGGGVEAGALRVTIASDSTGVVSVDDNGGALTVDATNLDIRDLTSASDSVAAVCTNAGTFAVQATLGAETTKVIGTVNVAAGQTIAVTNAGTFAVQAAQATAGNLNCTEASAADIKTAVELIDNAISGTEMQVDVVASLPAGTNAIGKLAANSGVDIGDVDILSIAAGDNNIGNVDIATIAAGDNNIGNVDIASAIPAGTNNIGDVDVLSIANASINGPGVPVIDSYSHVAINLASGPNQVLVSSAASKQIWVYGVNFTTNVAGTISFQDEDDTAITGIMQIDAKGGLISAPSGNFAMPIWKLATDKDLEVDIVTSEVDGWLNYAIVSV